MDGSRIRGTYQVLAVSAEIQEILGGIFEASCESVKLGPLEQVKDPDHLSLCGAGSCHGACKVY